MNEVTKKDQALMDGQSEAPMGFEEEEEGEMIIPRVKVIQTLSPERKEGTAAEGDIINSLTQDKLNGKTFIPVFKFNNNIRWTPRADGGGIACQARNGKNGVEADGKELLCAKCRKNEFDNTKTGKDAIPTCTKYINFFGFIEGERIPMILSFSKTNYNEGKKLYSLAKVTMQNMWNNGYEIKEKLISKNSNEWYIITANPVGKTSEEDRAFAIGLFKNFRNTSIDYDIDENQGSTTETGATNEEVESSEF